MIYWYLITSPQFHTIRFHNTTFSFTGLETKGSVKAVRTPEDGRKHARNMLRFY
jgi:hypothetical protein